MHTSIVVEGRIDAVGSNGVDFQLLEVRHIALTTGAVCQWINETGWFPKGVGAAGDDSTYNESNQWTRHQAREHIPWGWYATPLI